MEQLFKKAAVFTDLHLGAKSNSLQHIKDCEDFVDWFIATAKKENCDVGIFMGDWSHHRNTINLLTLNASVRCLEKLGSAFSEFYWFPGNHDNFYKDKRDVHSSEFGKHIPGITIVNETTTIKNCTLVPWLVGDEWKEISSIQSKYMFGHFELPLFYMNAQVQMPDHGTLQTSHFQHQDLVFSGHFHKRQSRGKIHYIGNAFPHNFSDSWDDDRGMITLEWDKEPVYHNWEDCPKYRTVSLSQLLDAKDTIIKSKMHLKVNLDIDISYEEANFLKETFVQTYNLREFSLLQDNTLVELDSNPTADIKFESVDQIVLDNLTSINSDKFSQQLLMEIYQGL